MVEENTQKFGSQTIGIHGVELPLYSSVEDSKQWWKFFPRGSPNVQSQLLLKQNHKYWAPNDEMLLSDGRVDAGPLDSFKVGRVSKPGAKQIAEKVTNINHVQNS